MWIRLVAAIVGIVAISLIGVDAGVAQGTIKSKQESAAQTSKKAAPQAARTNEVNTVVRAPSKLPAGLSLRAGKLSVGGGYKVQVQSATTARLNNSDGGSGTLTCEGCCTISWSGGTLSCTKNGDCGCISKIEIPLPKAGVMAR